MRKILERTPGAVRPQKPRQQCCLLCPPVSPKPPGRCQVLTTLEMVGLTPAPPAIASKPQPHPKESLQSAGLCSLATSLPASVTHLCTSASIPTLNREPQASPSCSVPTPCPSKTRPRSQRGPSLPRHLRLVPPSPPPRCGRQMPPCQPVSRATGQVHALS